MHRVDHMPWLLIAAGVLVLAVGGAARAQGADTEQKRAYRAAFVLKFMQYTRWPDTAFENEQSPVVVTVLGDALAPHLQRLVVGERVQGRSVVIRRLNPPAADAVDAEWQAFRDSVAGSHALYIDSAFDAQLRRAIESVRPADVLTISDARGFAARGGMLGLVFKDDRYAFEANLDEIRKTAIVVSSKVLELAKIVSTRAGSRRADLPGHVHARSLPLQSTRAAAGRAV